MFDLANKTIAITGAAGLLGRMHAEVIAKFGGNLVLLDIDSFRLSNLASELSDKFDVDVFHFALDITNENEIKEVISSLQSMEINLYALINNASNNPTVTEERTEDFSRLENFPINNWAQDIAVGLTGAFLCSKHFGFLISKTAKGGVIINISSDLGLIAPDQRLYEQPNLSKEDQPVKPITYSVIKSGLIGMTRYIATYWADKNVRCNALCPGGVKNNQPKVFLDKVSSRIPLGRLAEKNEYQSSIIWMLSDSSSYLNGAIISVDGGRTTW